MIVLELTNHLEIVYVVSLDISVLYHWLIYGSDAVRINTNMIHIASY